ncbi:MAG TPA: hypothetical protein VGI81_12530 [Tepidisphaeraceae bacterium]|jgi:hypothetical protein
MGSKKKKKPPKPSRSSPKPPGTPAFIAKTVPTEEAAFQWAVAFELTSRKLERDLVEAIEITRDAQKLFLVSIPFSVNRAFTIELYLKCIWALTNRNVEVPPTHDLDVLRKGLPVQTWSRIVKLYHDHLARTNTPRRSNLPPHETDSYDLEAVVYKEGLGFEDWRYGFEGGRVGSASTLPVTDAIRRAIIELKPEWAAIAVGLDR